MPGPRAQELLREQARESAPMGPKPSASVVPSLVMAAGRGSSVLDVDGNQFVDLAAGFGALLLGHSHPAVVEAVATQSQRLLQALGDVYPSDVKLQLMTQLNRLYPKESRCILAQSGSDAVAAALKTAALATRRAGVLAFQGAYHGLGYGPLALCGLRSSYREPFAAQLNPHVTFLPYPGNLDELVQTVAAARKALSNGEIGALVIEPVLGRGGVITPPLGFLAELRALCSQHGTLLIADEIWTGLGRAGAWLSSLSECVPDLICLGKGLGGGLPISAVIGDAEVLSHWQQAGEVVHTSTFAGAPLSCAAALATLHTLRRDGLVEHAAARGLEFRQQLSRALDPYGVEVRGRGWMLGLEANSASPGFGGALQRELLTRGYITSTGGGRRDVLVLTPPLIIADEQLQGFVQALIGALGALRAS